MLIRDILTRPAGAALAAGLALVLSVLAPPARAQQDSAPVQAVRAALMEFTPSNDDPKALEERKEKLRQLTDEKSKLQDLGDMAQALLLPNWWSDTSSDSYKKVDRDAYKALLNRFLSGLRGAVKAAENAPFVRAAVATLVGEFAASARSDLTSRRGGGNRLLLEDLPRFSEVAAELAEKDRSPEVRAAAASALTKIQSDPKNPVTVPALKTMLKAADPAVRRSAALALGDLMRGTRSADRGGFAASPVVKPSANNLTDFGPQVARAAGAVLSGDEPDAEVRRLAAAALIQVASDLSNSLSLRMVSHDTQQRSIQPVIDAVWAQASALERATGDQDPRVRHTALRALETIGEARQNWLSPRVEPLTTPPPLDKPRGGLGKPLTLTSAREEMTGLTLTLAAAQAPPVKPKDESPPPLASAVPALVARLRVDNVRNRLAAVDALETITAHASNRTVAQDLGAGPAAEAARALTRALSDPDRFVRWASARTLGEMAPLNDVENGESVERGAVAGLARQLSDADPDVRMRSAIALGLFGKAARDAVPSLARAVVNLGDLEARISAARAIEIIGGHAAEAVPALAENMGDSNVRMRRSAAAALSSYGSAAAAAKPALNRALFDADPEVRRIASAALLKIGTGR